MYLILLDRILPLRLAVVVGEEKEDTGKASLAHPGAETKKDSEDNKIRSQQKAVYTLRVGSRGL